jgi:hypothetical protein
VYLGVSILCGVLGCIYGVFAMMFLGCVDKYLPRKLNPGASR